MTNKQGDLKLYVDLQVQTGRVKNNMCFFLTDLGNHQLIFGYPWFVASQPRIDWAKGWIDHGQLPIILKADDAPRLQLLPPPSKDAEPVYAAYVQVPASETVVHPPCLHPVQVPRTRPRVQ